MWMTVFVGDAHTASAQQNRISPTRKRNAARKARWLRPGLQRWQKLSANRGSVRTNKVCLTQPIAASVRPLLILTVLELAQKPAPELGRALKVGTVDLQAVHRTRDCHYVQAIHTLLRPPRQRQALTPLSARCVRLQSPCPCYTALVKARGGQTARDDLQGVNPAVVEHFQALVLGWYVQHARQFAWRTPNPDPYVVLVSETMLQQTQTHRVQQKLSLFLQLFPDFATLAASDNASIIRAWQGMGYNNRALRLRDCARVVMKVYDGVLPADAQALQTLPGIGPYTVSAILSFAFHKDVPVLDVNIRRLYSRVFGRVSTVVDVLPEAALRIIASEVFPKGRSSDWHQACMDIAAQFCTARTACCLLCPVSASCCSACRLADAVPIHVQEPSFRGRPNRIWRGRIVELLRGLEPGQELSYADLKAILSLEDTADDTAWIGSLLSALERDGLIGQSPSGISLHS